MKKTEEFDEVNANLKRALGKSLQQILEENKSDAAEKLIQNYKESK